MFSFDVKNLAKNFPGYRYYFALYILKIIKLQGVFKFHSNCYIGYDSIYGDFYIQNGGVSVSRAGANQALRFIHSLSFGLEKELTKAISNDGRMCFYTLKLLTQIVKEEFKDKYQLYITLGFLESQMKYIKENNIHPCCSDHSIINNSNNYIYED